MRRWIAVAAMVAGLAGAAQAADRHETEVGPVLLETVAEGFDHPWSMAFLPDGRMLVTEREGALRVVSDGQLSAPVAGLPAVSAVGQGGLLDVVLHPQFAANRLVYLSFAEPREGGNATAVPLHCLLNLTMVLPSFVYCPRPLVDLFFIRGSHLHLQCCWMALQ